MRRSRRRALWPCSAARRVRALAAGAALVLAACGGGGNSSSPDAPPTVSPQTTAARAVAPATVVGAPLQSDWGTYPRLVRLAHQADRTQNGLVLGTVTERVDGRWKPGVHVSDDQGATFSRRGSIDDPDFDKGVCCGSVYELPQPVGVLATGMLVVAVSVGHDSAGTFMQNRIYVSSDAGRSFQRLGQALCGASALPRVPGEAGTGVWEPVFFVAGDGALACIYSDETVHGASQVLRLTKTLDGVQWTAPVTIVAGADQADRPGMANVAKLPSGRYAMSFETCSTARLDCAAHVKMSDDGLAWGPAGDMGTRPETADGSFFRHTPTLVWTPFPGSADGRLVLAGQLFTSASGVTDVAASGRTMLVNDRREGAGAWTRVAMPVGLADAPTVSNWCWNYSTSLLPSVDGRAVLVWQTDLDADGGCRVRFGQGTVAG